MIAAIDCDLRKVYCLRDDGRVVAKAAPTLDSPALDALCEASIILFEIAGPLDYTDNKAIAHQKRRWTIWNIACAQRLDIQVTFALPRPTFLVAPSSDWTKQYKLAQRHALAGCKQPQKDLRECEAMIAFYRRDPTPWVPLRFYLENL